MKKFTLVLLGVALGLAVSLLFDLALPTNEEKQLEYLKSNLLEHHAVHHVERKESWKTCAACWLAVSVKPAVTVEGEGE